MEGWVKLHRKLAENPLWTCEPFTRGQAWVDLFLLANHEYNFFYKRGIKIEVKRGQVGISEIGLSDRWKWSRSKVKKYLKDLEKEQQITIIKTNVTQIVTILNYDLYQSKEQQLEQQKNNRRAAEEQQKDTNKNDKNYKNENNDKKINISFDLFWDLYDKKIDKPKCEKKWIKLSDIDREQIMDYIPKYKESQPEKQFRKNPMTFFNNRSWENEIVSDKIEFNFPDKWDYRYENTLDSEQLPLYWKHLRSLGFKSKVAPNGAKMWVR